MKKYFIFLLVLFCIFNLNAENISNRRSNPNYKNLKVYVKVLEHYGNHDCYLAQIDILNTGNNSVSFWETTSNYAWIFSFTAAGVWFINQNQRSYYEKKITDIPSQRAVSRKVRILPGGKYVIKMLFYIYNKDRFIKTNKNLRVVFLFNDANLEFREDVMVPKVISENTIEYKW